MIGRLSTAQAWLRKYGKHDLLRRAVRVETADERDRIKALAAKLRDLQRTLADAKAEETLARA